MCSTFFKYKFVIVLQVRKQHDTRRRKTGLRPDGLGVDHCFPTSIVTLRKSITLSDISCLMLKIKKNNNAYLNIMYDN